MAKKASAKVVKAEEQVSPASPPVFTACRQCSNPGDCARSGKCRKGFK